MEGDPSVRVLGDRDGMLLKWEQAHTPDWDETGGFAPAARYNSTTARGNNLHRFLQAFVDITQHKQAGTEI